MVNTKGQGCRGGQQGSVTWAPEYLEVCGGPQWPAVGASAPPFALGPLKPLGRASRSTFEVLPALLRWPVLSHIPLVSCINYGF